MCSTLRKGLLVVLGLWSAQAFATPFVFSFSVDGYELTGEFEGTAGVNNYVTVNSSLVSMTFRDDLGGLLWTGDVGFFGSSVPNVDAWDTSVMFQSGVPIVSRNYLENNFIFSGSEELNNPSFEGYFYMVGGDVGLNIGSVAMVSPFLLTTDLSSWDLDEKTTSVPDGGATALLLFSALACLRLLRVRP